MQGERMVERRAVPRGLKPRALVSVQGVLAKLSKLTHLPGGDALSKASVEVGDDMFQITLLREVAESAETIELGSGVLIEGTLVNTAWELGKGGKREKLTIAVERIVALERPYRKDQIVAGIA